MKDLVNVLMTRYEAVLQSSHDSLFYQNVHAYLDWIVKNPSLYAIIKKSEEEYHRKHSEIWRVRKTSDVEIDEQSEFTYKLERFNLYAAHYCILECRIYLPIEDYKTTNDPDCEQDPVALIMLKGIKKLPIKKWYHKFFFKWRPERVSIYNKWYEGKRDYYQNELRQFHVDFVTELEKELIREKEELKNKKTEPAEIKSKKLNIRFDPENSILFLNDKEVSMKAKNDITVGHDILDYIINKSGNINKIHFYSEIIDEMFPDGEKSNKAMYDACKYINVKALEATGIKDFLSVGSGKYGSVRISREYI